MEKRSGFFCKYFFADVPDVKWSACAVIRILQEETYTGVLLQGKQETHNHKLKNIIHKPAEEWVRIENAHEPIIQKRDFDLVQKISSLDTRTVRWSICSPACWYAAATAGT